MDQQLHVFVTVVEKGNFSRAAEELHMTQPAVSQYIQNFERLMGTKLLDRSNKFVKLNKAGEIVYHHAKEILGLYTKMHYLVDDLTNKTTGPLLIGASYTFGEYVLPHIIAKMHAKYPQVKPSITIGNTKEIAELALGHQIDIGVVEGHFADKGLLIEPFATDSMLVVVSNSHPLAGREEAISISELQNETWIVRENGSGTREAVEQMFKLHNLSPESKLEFGSTQLIKESVEAGLGISLLSDWAIRKERSMNTLQVLKIKDFSVKRNFSLVLRSPFQTKALSVFLDLLKAPETYADLRHDEGF
jgi:LysR family transcriptional regulator, transcriptional activator of the cysJI operon